MIRHARAATPWLVLGVAALLIPVLLRVLESDPYLLWPLQGIAVGLLAGTGVWCFDEPAAAVVDAAPRGLAWRTAAKSAGVLLLAIVWVLSVTWTSTAYFGHAREVAVQGLVGLLVAVAVATWGRSRGVATPARRAASVLVPAACYFALVRPLEESLPLFPYLSDGPWRESLLLWSATALTAVLVLTAALVRLNTVHAPRSIGRGV